MSAADGYARVTGRTQCVIVHVDVGTAALGQALQNASNGRAPVLIFAGLAPYTLHGELPGSRSEHVHWYQDIANQASIVAPYARYSNEIKGPEHTRTLVRRAFLMASSGSPGPSYLTATREVLAATTSIQGTSPEQKMHFPSCRMGGLPRDAVKQIGDALLFAAKPLITTGYLGRNHAAVRNLIKLANLIKGLRVLDFETREMSFPASHPGWLSRSTGGGPAIKEADVILVLDADVPWIPTKISPSAFARIFHIDIDPRKERVQIFDIEAECSFWAECEIAIQQLYEYIESHPSLLKRQLVFEQRWKTLVEEHGKGSEVLRLRAQPRKDGLISNYQLFDTMRQLLPRGTTYLHDAVTNQVPLVEHLQLDLPGTSISKGGSGLGWAGGAAIGAKLALDIYDTTDRPNAMPRSDGQDTAETFICCVTGDGSFVFGSPTATYWAQHRLGTPFLTIILNNGGWKAPRSCINDVHPDGVAASLSDGEMGINLKLDGPDYAGVAVAASNGTLWATKVSIASELEDGLKAAVDVVQNQKRGALLEVLLSI